MTKKEFIRLPLSDKMSEDEVQRVREAFLNYPELWSKYGGDKDGELKFLYGLNAALEHIFGYEFIHEIKFSNEV